MEMAFNSWQISCSTFSVLIVSQDKLLHQIKTPRKAELLNVDDKSNLVAAINDVIEILR